ncbi:MAG: ribose-phosphate diphosphokinase [Treponema sp.]|nr:ribose-phosphate diphosphokinase [Treponema sp.]
MNYSTPSNLGIIACPGGEIFADEVILHLKNDCHRQFERIVSKLAKRYNLEEVSIIRKFNFIYDTTSCLPSPYADPAKFRPAAIKIPAQFTMFTNGEIKAEVMESVRGKDIFIVQDVENHFPVNFNDGDKRTLSINDHLMTLLVTVDAVKQADANRITLVLPTYPYSRQHKKKGREGLTASRVGKLMEFLGVHRIITLDIHSREIGNSFNTMIIENLHASYQIIRTLSKMPGVLNDDFVVVSPDTGAVDRNKFYATALKKPLALLYKERDYSKVTENALENNIAEIKLLGNVAGKTVFMADDMLGTGGTLLKAMKFLKEQGAGKVISAISLPLFSGNAISYFDDAYKEGLFYRIIGTNAVYQEEVLKREWFTGVNITPLFAQTISRLHQELSLSSLLDNRDIIVKMLSEGSGDAKNQFLGCPST